MKRTGKAEKNYLINVIQIAFDKKESLIGSIIVKYMGTYQTCEVYFKNFEVNNYGAILNIICFEKGIEHRYIRQCSVSTFIDLILPSNKVKAASFYHY